MCGIVGIIGEKAQKDVLLSMTNAQNHRGPDYTGVWINEDICLGHNRLAIIDLSKEANQPFTDATNRYQLIFNGEIYNYLELKKELDYDFKTNSDTEVLLAVYIKWGKNCLHKLNGMFSFAIWDTIDKKLFAARDRFGVKPFFYHQSGNTFYFSSEIKALHATGIVKEQNKKVWANYFSYGSYGKPNETFWKDIYQLPGSHYLELNSGKKEINKWYFFENEIEKYKQKSTYEEVKSTYTKLLKDRKSVV